MKRNIITLILALAAMCGCQKTEKTIYKVPQSETRSKSTVRYSTLHRFGIISTSTKQS